MMGAYLLWLYSGQVWFDRVEYQWLNTMGLIVRYGQIDIKKWEHEHENDGGLQWLHSYQYYVWFDDV